jgi:hypothetical protein
MLVLGALVYASSVLSARKITQHDKRFFEARRLVQIASLTAAPGSEAAIIIPKIDDLKIVSELSPGHGVLGSHGRFNGSQAARQ